MKKLLEPPTSEEVKVETVKQQEEACSRCRVLYTGNKLFWRTQITYDIHIYLHLEEKCIEVIAYEGKRNTECPRLYLSEDILMQIIDVKSIQDKVNAKKQEASKERFVRVLPPDSVLFNEEKRLALSSYILSHLKNEEFADGKIPKFTTPDVLFDISAHSELNPVYAKIPESVTPVFVARRRHSTEAEINSKINDIKSLQADIRHLSSKAERISSLFSDGMNRLNANKGSSQLLDSYSIPRRRWIKIIARALRKNLVKKNTENMRSRFGNKFC